MHTIKILLLGFVLLAAFVLVGRALGNGSKAALYFLPASLARGRYTTFGSALPKQATPYAMKRRSSC